MSIPASSNMVCRIVLKFHKMGRFEYQLGRIFMLQVSITSLKSTQRTSILRVLFVVGRNIDQIIRLFRTRYKFKTRFFF